MDDQGKVQSVTDTDNEFIIKHQGKRSNQLAFTCQLTRIYENFKEKYVRSLQSTDWLFENSESNSYDKNDVKGKVHDLVSLQKAMQGRLKTASYSGQIQVLTLLTAKWSRM